MLEETGLSVRCGEQVGWVERIGDDHHFVILDYAVEVVGAHEPVAGDDAAEARWVPLGDVLSMELVAGMAEFLTEHGIL